MAFIGESYTKLKARLAGLAPVIDANRQAVILNRRDEVKAALRRALHRRRRRQSARLKALTAVSCPHRDQILHHVLVAQLVAPMLTRVAVPHDPVDLRRCTPVRGPTRSSRTRSMPAGTAT